MLYIRSTQRMDQVELGLRLAAEGHGGKVLGVSAAGFAGVDAVHVTLGFSELDAALLRADVRFAAFLPSRVAVCTAAGGVMLETIAPRECCRLLHAPEMEPLAAALEDTLRLVMEEAAHARHPERGVGEHAATEDQINMRATLPQRVDRRGNKVEEMAGTGTHDSQGG